MRCCAVPRFYFHLLNDVDAPDEEGKELPDLAAARLHAIQNLRFTAAETIKEQGKLVPGHRIHIEDASGNLLDSVSVAEAVKIEDD